MWLFHLIIDHNTFLNPNYLQVSIDFMKVQHLEIFCFKHTPIYIFL